jgi:hypothetical protein
MAIAGRYFPYLYPRKAYYPFSLKELHENASVYRKSVDDKRRRNLGTASPIFPLISRGTWGDSERGGGGYRPVGFLARRICVQFNLLDIARRRPKMKSVAGDAK